MLEKMSATFRIKTKTDPKFLSCSQFIGYIEQYNLVKSYTPTVVSDREICFTVPYSDAKKIRKGTLYVQVFWKNQNNVPCGIKKKAVMVDEAIPEEGYDGVVV